MDTRSGRPLRVWAGTYDALGALQASRLGYDALWLSSLGLSVGRLGLPDAGFLRPETVLTAIAEITNVVDLPVVVDFENGYGRQDRDLSDLAADFFRAGSGALCMEDTVGAKRNSLWAQYERDLAAPADMARRLGLLVEVAGELGGSIVARTETLVEGRSIAEATDRVQTYAAAGCSAVVVHFRTDVEAVLEVARRCELPPGVQLVVIPTKSPALRFEDFAAAGFHVYVAANVALRAAATAMWESLHSVLRLGHQQSAVEHIASLADLDEIVRTDALVPGARAGVPDPATAAR
jgi:2-methylisocitrate lyase-like PEP mutase family enzyme